MLCILSYIGLVIVGMFLPETLRAIAGLGILAIALTSTVLVFLLATKVYGTALGIVFGFLTLVPCIGLIMLLVINAKATSILRAEGIHVGFLGASASDI